MPNKKCIGLSVIKNKCFNVQKIERRLISKKKKIPFWGYENDQFYMDFRRETS